MRNVFKVLFGCACSSTSMSRTARRRSALRRMSNSCWRFECSLQFWSSGHHISILVGPGTALDMVSVCLAITPMIVCSLLRTVSAACKSRYGKQLLSKIAVMVHKPLTGSVSGVGTPRRKKTTLVSISQLALEGSHVWICP